MHMNKYRTILWMLLVGLSASLNAQQPSLFTSGVETNPEFKNFYFQVKHIEDFMSRFNGETNVMDSTQIEGWRYKNLLFLFDEQTYYANEALADTLIHRQLNSACRLDYTASNWSAVAECNVLYKKAKKTVLLTLQTEKVEDYIYKWVITDAQGEILDLKPEKRNPGLRISPTDNEVDFISLKHITSAEAVNILNFAKKDYMPESLSVFYSLVYTKQLQIESIQSVTYHFYNIHGMDLEVKRHLEDKAHSGWLITGIRKHE